MAVVGQPTFYIKGPVEITGNLLSHSNGNIGSESQKWANGFFSATVTGNNSEFYSYAGETGYINQLSVENFYPVGEPDLGHENQRWNNLYLTGDIFADEIECQTITGNSAFFSGLQLSHIFIPPKLTFEQRTGIWSGVLTPEATPYDGLVVYQMTSGQQLMVVQSGVWKTFSLV